MGTNHVVCEACGHIDPETGAYLPLPIEPGAHGPILALLLHVSREHPRALSGPRDWDEHEHQVALRRGQERMPGLFAGEGKGWRKGW